jgi:hypothetical protein
MSASVGVSTALIENYGTSSVKRHQWYLSDVGLSLSHARLFTIPGVGIGVGGGISMNFPSSLQSRYRDLIFGTRAALRLSKVLFKKLYLSYGFSFFKNFNRYTSPTIRQEDTDDYVVLAHYRGNEQIAGDLISVGGNNTSFGLSNGFLASLNITDKLAFAVFYSLAHSWTYRSYPDDEFTAEYADGGRAMRDSQSGVIDLSYQFNRQISGSVGVQTMVSPKTSDNKGYVFPFANFSNNYRNNTGIYLSVGARF